MRMIFIRISEKETLYHTINGLLLSLISPFIGNDEEPCFWRRKSLLFQSGEKID
jgi:hypothetical protein